MKKILYIMGGWYSNIGNAIIDIGAIYTLNRIFDDSTISFISGCSYYPDRRGKYPDIIKHIDVDYIVLSGMSLNGTPFGYYFDSLINRKSKSKLLYIGAGGETYSTKEKDKVRECLSRLKPYLLVSRDSISYSLYNDLFKHSYDGIDVAFTLPKFYNPPKIDEKYAVMIDASAKTNMKSYSFKHDCSKYNNPRGTMDTPWHYITIYSNATELYSSRIHGAVVGVSYGVPTRLISDSPRKAIFERIGLEDIQSKLCTVDYDYLDTETEKQISYMEEVLE